VPVVGVKLSRGDTAVLWHDVECGSYSADLPLWRELVAEAAGPVLDLGCGTGRVALELAELGHDVTALDIDPRFIEELRRRTRERDLHVTTVVGEASTFHLDGSFALAIAPMQLVQIVGGSAGRAAMLTAVRRHLLPGGRFAAALADTAATLRAEHQLPPLPDVMERDGWVLSSQPLDVRPERGGVAVDRLRQLVSPAGELSDELHTIHLDAIAPDELEEEGRAAGLRPAGRRSVPETADHVGSTVVILESPA
jgi:SAM-dependent methyltransferase